MDEMIVKCCGNCRWRKPYEEDCDADVENECRRFPPQVYGDFGLACSTFPGVRLEEYCGKWEERTQDDA